MTAHDALTPKELYTKLQAAGFRMTTSRKAMIDVLYRAKTPLSVQQILAALKRKKIEVNKTTAYREIEFLIEQHIIESIQFGGEQMKRYEFALGSHHHHIQCVRCGNVADVDMPDELQHASRTIQKQTGFRVLDHSLEFVGLCSTCQKATTV